MKYLVEIGKHFKIVVSYCGEGRVIMRDSENLCCKRFKMIDRVHIPEIKSYWIAVNYCPVCGRKLERQWNGLER